MCTDNCIEIPECCDCGEREGDYCGCPYCFSHNVCEECCTD